MGDKRDDAQHNLQREGDGAMSQYNSDFSTAQDGNVLQRIQESICSTAIAIQSEAVNTALHSQRSAYARQVLLNPSGYAAFMAYGICAGGNVTTSSTDAQIDTRVSSVWNAFATET